MFRKLVYRAASEVFFQVLKAKKGFDAMILKQIKVTESFRGTCSALFTVEKDICNENGQMSNGFSTTLVDTVTSTALSTILVTKPHVTVSLNMEYYKPAILGDQIIITSDVIKLGRTLAFMEALLKNKMTGDLVAKGIHVKFILK